MQIILYVLIGALVGLTFSFSNKNSFYQNFIISLKSLIFTCILNIIAYIFLQNYIKVGLSSILVLFMLAMFILQVEIRISKKGQ